MLAGWLSRPIAPRVPTTPLPAKDHIMRFIQWLFKSRYTASLEADNERIRAELATWREWHAQITSNLLQGAGMPGIEVSKPQPATPPKARLVPSQWRRNMEARDRESAPKETN